MKQTINEFFENALAVKFGNSWDVYSDGKNRLGVIHNCVGKNEFEAMGENYHLFDCFECGCCSYVCPSQIPLVQYYRFAKSEIWEQEHNHKISNIARQRHESRVERLENQKRER